VSRDETRVGGGWQQDVLPLNYSRVALQEQQLSHIAKARFVSNETFENALPADRFRAGFSAAEDDERFRSA
jgi:hypothetical protein